MKTNFFLVALFIVGIFLNFSCETEEDAVPIACFEASTTAADVGDIISFSNCSTDATHYGWDFGDGVKVTDISPSHVYEEPGTYTVQLTAYNKDKVNQSTTTITISGGSSGNFDPRDYNSVPSSGWDKYYGNDFSASGEWTEETNSDYVTSISEGAYNIENLTEGNNWSFFAGSSMPSSSGDYDIDAFVTIVYENANYGSGLTWAYNTSNQSYYYFKQTYFNNEYWSILGDSDSGSWLSTNDGWDLLGGSSGQNLLTIRKFNNKYYFFINQVFVFENEYLGDFGDKFGFVVGPLAKISIDEITIHNMNFGSRKTASPKVYNTMLNAKGIGSSNMEVVGNIKK